jgi:CRP/FNR family transcriptional regulator, cyclic AMP receptor protein
MSNDSRATTVSIVEADPDLADLLGPRELDRARHEARATVLRLWPGDWDAAASMEPERHHRGFLIVDGLLTRDVQVIGRQCVEMLGHGDVMRPWTWDGEGSHVHAEIGWTILEATHMAVLDQQLVTRIAPWPQLGVELFNRGTRRAHALAVSLAISYHQRVDDRLMLTLWHLAERWGRVHSDGIVVQLPLSHQRLADLVGAHRPSVTTALGKLTRAASLSRRENGDWVLHGSPPRELRHHRLAGIGAGDARKSRAGGDRERASG